MPLPRGCGTGLPCGSAGMVGHLGRVSTLHLASSLGGRYPQTECAWGGGQVSPGLVCTGGQLWNFGGARWKLGPASPEPHAPTVGDKGLSFVNGLGRSELKTAARAHVATAMTQEATVPRGFCNFDPEQEGWSVLF